jgi:hypothetical protein
MKGCIGCGEELNGYNTKGVFRTKGVKSVRCGKCYLEHKRKLRLSKL